jgi:hypothetical protein
LYGARVRTVEELAGEYVDLVCEAFPTRATALGRHEHDHRLGSYDAATFDAHASAVRRLRRELAPLTAGHLIGHTTGHAIGASHPCRSVDARALDGLLATELLELEREQQWRRNPDRAVDGALSACFALLLRAHAPAEERAAALADRLGAVPAYLEQARSAWSDVPALWAWSAAESASAGVGFLRGDLAIALDGVRRRDVVMAAAERAADALEHTAATLRELQSRDGHEWALGEPLVAEHLRVEHHLAQTPAATAAAGRALVAETTDRLDAIDPDWRAAFGRSKDDHPAARGLVAAYRAEMERVRDYVARHGLAAATEAPLDVRPSPRFWAHLIPYAAYDPPGYFEPDQRGVFWVTVPEGERVEERLRGHPWPGIVVTAVHEGYPGHHLQLTRANQAAGLVRTLAASTLTIEGWAFYCEEMLGEAGYYGDDHGLHISQLKDQLWRAVRVVVDMGLHCGDLTFEAAVDELVRVADLEPANAEAEVRRYTSSPTYQICYAIGKAEIVRLREELRARGGAAFDLGRFHDELLGYGSVPVPLVAEAMLEAGAPAGEASRREGP